MTPNLKFEKSEGVVRIYRDGVKIGSIIVGDTTSLPYFYGSILGRSDLFADELEMIAKKMNQVQHRKRA